MNFKQNQRGEVQYQHQKIFKLKFEVLVRPTERIQNFINTWGSYAIWSKSYRLEPQVYIILSTIATCYESLHVVPDTTAMVPHCSLDLFSILTLDVALHLDMVTNSAPSSLAVWPMSNWISSLDLKALSSFIHIYITIFERLNLQYMMSCEAWGWGWTSNIFFSGVCARGNCQLERRTGDNGLKPGSSFSFKPTWTTKAASGPFHPLGHVGHFTSMLVSNQHQICIIIIIPCVSLAPDYTSIEDLCLDVITRYTALLLHPST